jgi:hypothetical protein
MTTLTPTAVTEAEATRADVHRWALDMVDKGRDPGLIAAYMREEARRHPAAFVTDWAAFVTDWAPFVTCPCGNLTDTPTRLAACCSTECEENEVIWAELREYLRRVVGEPVVSPGSTMGGRRDIPGWPIGVDPWGPR